MQGLPDFLGCANVAEFVFRSISILSGGWRKRIATHIFDDGSKPSERLK